MSQLLSCVEVEPASEVSASVIWLHGLGADGHDFEPVLPWLGLPDSLAVRFVFPHAPRIPVTLNAGMVMPAWYDIAETDLQRRHDRDGILRSQEQIEELITREHERGLPFDRIVLAGFSQGGAVALHTALLSRHRLAGVLALSTYLVLEGEFEDARSVENANTPILQIHGTKDPMVPVERGRACFEQLSALGYTIEWQDYPMQHEVCPEELGRIGQWLTGLLAD